MLQKLGPSDAPFADAGYSRLKEERMRNRRADPARQARTANTGGARARPRAKNVIQACGRAIPPQKAPACAKRACRASTATSRGFLPSSGARNARQERTANALRSARPTAARRARVGIPSARTGARSACRACPGGRRSRNRGPSVRVARKGNTNPPQMRPGAWYACRAHLRKVWARRAVASACPGSSQARSKAQSVSSATRGCINPPQTRRAALNAGRAPFRKSVARRSA